MGTDTRLVIDNETKFGTDVNIIKNSDFYLSVAKGGIDGYSWIDKYGENPVILNSSFIEENNFPDRYLDSIGQIRRVN